MPNSETFGLSNFAAWEVAEVVGICKANGWVKPRIYQVYFNYLFVLERTILTL